jgi:hypothetical protein
MSDHKEINCEELAKKMSECLENGDDEQCKEFVEEFNTSCKKEEKPGLLSWVFGEKKEEVVMEEDMVEEMKEEMKEEDLIENIIGDDKKEEQIVKKCFILYFGII